MRADERMNPVGTWEVRRRISIPALEHEADAMTVVRALSGLQGVKRVRADVCHHRVQVRYDARASGYLDIIEVLEKNGFPPQKGWWSRVKANLYQFADTNARDNAKVPPPACCNKPPK